jgi:putative oxidoreductase
MMGYHFCVQARCRSDPTLLTRLDALCARLPYDVLALLARFAVGMVFFRSGLTKVDWNTWTIAPSTYFLFANEFKVPVIPPELAAMMATSLELTAPILLWLGLLTRPAALALLAMVLVIQTFVYPGSYVEHGLWAVALLVLVKFGPGRLALDSLLTRENAGR